MNKAFKIYVILFVGVMVLLGMLELGKKDVVDWRKNFDVDKKTPFGLFIFHKEANKLFHNKLKTISESPYNFFENEEKFVPRNILIVDKNIDETSWGKILKQVEQGSDLMYIGRKLDALEEKFATDYLYIIDEEATLQLTDQKMKDDTLKVSNYPAEEYIFRVGEGVEILGFSKMKDVDYEQEAVVVDSTVGEQETLIEEVVIGGDSNEKKDKKYANFIKYKRGKGNIYVHTDPLFLTNYYLLNGKNQKYLEGVFSHLPDRETIWFLDDSIVKESISPLRVILANPPLKYAWWLFLAGLLLFIIFNAKRRQRIVPVVELLKNKSAEFVKSVGNLYLQEGDFHDMMAKKAQYFLYKVRTEFFLDTSKLDEDFAKKIHLKTGRPVQEIDEAISLIKKATNPSAQVSQEDLVRMNQLLDKILI